MRKRGHSFYSKRGQIEHELLTQVTWWVLIAIVFLGMMMYVNDKRNNSDFEKNYYARDMALLATTVYAAPGNVYYSYDTFSALYGIRLKFLDSVLSVNNIEEPGLTAVFHYAADPNIGFTTKSSNPITQGEFAGGLLAPFTTHFLKYDSNILITDTYQKELRYLTCPKADTKDPTWASKRIVFNPTAGPEFINLAQQLKVILPVELTLDLATGSPITYTPNPDIMISISSTVPKNFMENPVKVYVPIDSKAENLKLACLMANNLAKKYSEVSSVSVIPINQDFDGDISLSIEVGNIKTVDAAEAIRDSIVQFYEAEDG